MARKTVRLHRENSSKYLAFDILKLQKYLVQIVNPIMAGHPEELRVVMEHLNSAEIRVLEQGRRLQLYRLTIGPWKLIFYLTIYYLLLIQVISYDQSFRTCESISEQVRKLTSNIMVAGEELVRFPFCFRYACKRSFKLQQPSFVQ